MMVNYPYVDSLVRNLRFVLWGLIIGLILTAVLVFGQFATNALPAGDAPRGRAFYWWLIFPSSLVSFLLSSIAARGILRVASWFLHGKLHVFRWFHPVAAGRDWFALSTAFAVLYLGFMILTDRNIATFSIQGETQEGWLMTRGIGAGLLAALVIYAYDALGWIAKGATIPQGPLRLLALPLYAILVPTAMFISGPFFVGLFESSTPTGWLAVAIGLTLACSLVVIPLWIAIAAATKGARSTPLPLRARLAVVGPTEFGKTLYFVQACNRLSNQYRLGVGLVPLVNEGTDRLIELGKALCKKHVVPPPSQETRMFEFTLEGNGRPLIEFRWHDLPGGAFEASNKSYAADMALFKAELPTTDGLLMVLSAHSDHAQALKDNQGIYFEAIKAFVIAHSTPALSGEPAAIAIVITQTQRPHNTLYQAKKVAKSIEDHGRRVATEYELRNLDIKIFEVDSLIDVDEKNHPKSCRSKRCGAPILWLASKVARSRLSALEAATSSLVGSASKVIAAVTTLEEMVYLDE